MLLECHYADKKGNITYLYGEFSNCTEFVIFIAVNLGIRGCLAILSIDCDSYVNICESEKNAMNFHCIFLIDSISLF